MKKLILFLGIAIGLGGYIFLYDNGSKDQQEQNTQLSIPLYDSFKAKHPYHIIIKHGEEVVDLKREWGGEWKVLNSGNYPADVEAVDELMKAVLDAQQKQVVSNNPQNWDKFEVVEDRGIEVIFKEREDREIAHFWAGKTGTSYADQYVRKNNLDDVILINTNLSPLLTKPLNAWRNQSILKIEQDKIESISVTAKNEEEGYELLKSGSGWNLNDKEIEHETVNVVLAAIADLKTIDFPEEEIELDEETADYVVRILSDNSKYKLYFKQKDTGGNYYILVEGNDTLFEIAEIKKNELINPDVFANTQEN